MKPDGYLRGYICNENYSEQKDVPEFDSDMSFCAGDTEITMRE